MATRTRKRKREAWHGTTTGFVNHKCRCDECKEAWADYHRDYRAKRFNNGKKKCRVKGCKQHAWPSAGNGLCRTHHERKMELKAKREARRRREKKARRRRAAART